MRQRESSISVFQTSNSTLQQQLEALQRQLISPEATTPSFVAKQRQQLAAAANAHAELQTENNRLRQELLDLRLALEAKSHGPTPAAACADANAAAAADEDPLVEAERLVETGDSGGGAAAAAVGELTAGAPGSGVQRSDWKVFELSRLQAENKQLQAKVRADVLRVGTYMCECDACMLMREVMYM